VLTKKSELNLNDNDVFNKFAWTYANKTRMFVLCGNEAERPRAGITIVQACIRVVFD